MLLDGFFRLAGVDSAKELLRFGQGVFLGLFGEGGSLLGRVFEGHGSIGNSVFGFEHVFHCLLDLACLLFDGL